MIKNKTNKNIYTTNVWLRNLTCPGEPRSMWQQRLCTLQRGRHPQQALRSTCSSHSVRSARTGDPGVDPAGLHAGPT